MRGLCFFALKSHLFGIEFAQVLSDVIGFTFASRVQFYSSVNSAVDRENLVVNLADSGLKRGDTVIPALSA